MSYVYPQVSARALMEHDGLPETALADEIARYIKEAWIVTDQILERCHTGHDHYLLLDFDANASLWAQAKVSFTLPEVITVYRNEPPVKSTKCAVFLSSVKQTTGRWSR